MVRGRIIAISYPRYFLLEPQLDFPNRLMNRPPKVDTSIINGTYKGFFEIIFQNNDSSVQNYHMDGYAFFVVG